MFVCCKYKMSLTVMPQLMGRKGCDIKPVEIGKVKLLINKELSICKKYKRVGQNYKGKGQQVLFNQT